MAERDKVLSIDGHLHLMRLNEDEHVEWRALDERIESIALLISPAAVLTACSNDHRLAARVIPAHREVERDVIGLVLTRRLQIDHETTGIGVWRALDLNQAAWLASLAKSNGAGNLQWSVILSTVAATREGDLVHLKVTNEA